MPAGTLYSLSNFFFLNQPPSLPVNITLGIWQQVDGSRKLLFLMGCVLDVFNYFFPHINVNRSSTMRSRRHLRNLQLFLCPHLINTFLILQNILLFIATEIKMNSLMSLNFHFISSISKQLYASQPWPHIKISSGLQRIPMHIPCLYVFDQNLMVVPCYWSFYRSSLSHVNVQIRAKNLSQLQEFSLPFFLFQ